MKKSFIWVFGAVLLTLTACVLPESDDPFERLPEESLEVIEGKLFPFSVSVATRATHRLEREGKLVGYLSSDLVQLAEFEGQEVALEGVWRNEKMRQIFWVEGIKVQTLEALENENEPQRFNTKRFTMQFPSSWEYSLAPNGVAYFLNKEDPNRRVFLTFGVEDYSPEAERIETNIVMNGFQGVKEFTTDDNGKEREVVTLFSNLQNQKYVFTATYFFDDFDTKKAVFDLLQSFVEGEEAVQEVIIAEQKAKAAQEAERLALSEAAAAANAAAAQPEATSLEKTKDLLSGLFTGEEAPEAPTKTEVIKEEEAPAPAAAPTVLAQGDYANLIDDRAYPYESSNLGFSLKVPYGHWYRSFGGLNGSLASIGVSNAPVNQTGDVKMWVKVLAKDQPTEDTTELITNGQVTLIKKRDGASVFEITGPLESRDVLWSLADSIVQ